MADPITDPRLAGERLLAFAREGRLVQGTWHDEDDGREIACLLGAAAGIDDATQCPASVMPAWVAHAMPGLFDGQSKAHALAFAIRWGETMVRPEWTMIDWDAVRAEWLAFVVQQAKDAAARAADHAIYAAAAVTAAGYAIYAANAVAIVAATVAAAASAAAAAAYHAASACAPYDAARVADAAAAAAAGYAARDAQADALMAAIKRAMEVARG